MPSVSDPQRRPVYVDRVNNRLLAEPVGAGPWPVVTFTRNVSYETASLAANASEDFTIAAGAQYQLLSVTSSAPAWIRVYGTSAARSGDTRTSPGGTVPNPGTEFYAELVTTTTPQTIRLSPVPLVQSTGGETFIRVRNNGNAPQAIALDFYTLTLKS